MIFAHEGSSNEMYLYEDVDSDYNFIFIFREIFLILNCIFDQIKYEGFSFLSGFG